MYALESVRKKRYGENTNISVAIQERWLKSLVLILLTNEHPVFNSSYPYFCRLCYKKKPINSYF